MTVVGDRISEYECVSVDEHRLTFAVPDDLLSQLQSGSKKVSFSEMLTVVADRISEYECVSIDEYRFDFFSEALTVVADRISEHECVVLTFAVTDDFFNQLQPASNGLTLAAQDVAGYASVSEDKCSNIMDKCPDVMDKCSDIMAMRAMVIPEDECSTIDLGEGESSYDCINRLTVGDFHLIPKSGVAVDEERCVIDGQYRRAMQYIEEAGAIPYIEKTVFNADKKYRDAVNLLIGAEASISCSFFEEKSLEDHEEVFFCDLECDSFALRPAPSPMSPMVLRNLFHPFINDLIHHFETSL